MRPKVSVIIPTKDRREALWRSLDSVLSQTLAPFEIIVVDDGSSFDISQELYTKYPKIRLFKNSVSQGGAAARNKGAFEASGDYLAFLDSDDEWLSNHLIDKIRLIEEKHADGAFGTFYLLKGNEEEAIVFNTTDTTNKNIGNAILDLHRFDARTSTFVFKKEAFNQIKFDEKLNKHQDWDLAINFDKKFKFILDKVPTVKIYVEQGEERMSQKLKHESSFYFINKNVEQIEANNIFMFCLKQIMRSQLIGESNIILDKYLLIATPYFRQLSFRNKVIFKLLKARLLNMGAIYKLRKKLK